MTSFETAAQIRRNTQSDGQAFLPAGVRRVLRQMLFFLGGLLLSSLQLTAGLSPFGVCFLAAVPTRYIFAAGTGAAAGYLLTLDSVSALRNVAALISVAVLSVLLCEFERVRRIRLVPSCVAATVILLCREFDATKFISFSVHPRMGALSSAHESISFLESELPS